MKLHKWVPSLSHHNLPAELCFISKCFVDTVGIAADYQKKLELLFPTITFVVTSKADSIYPIVSAASIAAKVTRDRVLENWTFMEKGWGEKNEDSKEFGSGYPGG